MSVLRKVAASDAVVWLDRVNFTQGGFINRNQLPDGTWLTVPCERDTMRGEIRHVRIAHHGNWPRTHGKTLRQRYGKADHFDQGEALISAVENAWRLSDYLAVLNWTCLQHLLAGLDIEVAQHWQHDLAARGDSISEKLADMVGLAGGSVYLSGPAGHRYLDLEPFRARKIAVRFFRHDGPNPSAVDPMMRHGALAD